MNFKNFILGIIATCMLVGTVGCDSDSSKDEDFKVPSENKLDITLTFRYYSDFIIDNPDETDLAFLDDLQNDCVIRTVIKIYKDGNVASGAEPAASLEIEKNISGEIYDFTTTVSILPGKYVVKAWTDFRKNIEDEHFYSISSLSHARLERHSGLSSHQDAFSGSFPFEIVAEHSNNEFTIDMTRPLGRYIIISENNDAVWPSESDGISAFSVVTAYSGFYPDTYSMVTGRLADSITGEYFSLSPKFTGDGKVAVGGDYVLMNQEGTSVDVTLTLINQDGVVSGKSETLKIPLERNELKIVKVKFRGGEDNENSGFGIDTGFDGDLNVTPDKDKQ